ncbi:hypothetical protein KKB40_06470, partial [Patescibacteria group bacterium]|nr:hypothetical protein [Patescibacteria group bacterium]
MKGLPRWLLALFSILLVSCVGLLVAYFVLSDRGLIVPTSNDLISISSDVSELSAGLVQKDSIFNLLQKRGFFENGARVYGEGSNWVYPKKLSIVLTQEVQAQSRVVDAESGTTYRSFGTEFDDAESLYRLRIHWDSVIWEGEQNSNEWLSEQFSRDVIRALIKVTRQSNAVSGGLLSDEEKVILDSYSSEAVFEVEKKSEVGFGGWLMRLGDLIVPSVLAQSCGGPGWDCGNDELNCVCSAGSQYNYQCSNDGQPCGTALNPGTCSCSDHCGVIASGGCSGLSESECGNPCASYECGTWGCGWDDGGVPVPTTPPGGPTATPVPVPTIAGVQRGKFGVAFFHDENMDGNWDVGESALSVDHEDVRDSIETVLNIPGFQLYSYQGRSIENNVCLEDTVANCTDRGDSACVCPNVDETCGVVMRPRKQYVTSGNVYWTCDGDDSSPRTLYSEGYHWVRAGTARNCIGQDICVWKAGGLGLSTNNVDVLVAPEINGENDSVTFGFNNLLTGWEITRIRWNTSYYPGSNIGSQILTSNEGVTSISTNLEDAGSISARYKIVGRIIHVGVAQEVSCEIGITAVPPPRVFPGTSIDKAVSVLDQIGGSITSVAFTSDDPSIATLTSPSLSPFSTTITGVAVGSTTYTAIATMDDVGATTCPPATATVRVNNPDSWWQAVGGSIVAGSEYISSVIPANCSLLPGCVPFIVAGEGMPIAGTTITSGAGGPSESG